MNDRGNAFDERIREAASDYNSPPSPPREAMWAAIRAARTPRRPNRYAAWSRRAIGLAAAVVIGIALGRVTATRGPAEGPPIAESTPAERARQPTRPGLYQLAAAEHLGRAEALLVQFRTAGAGESVDAEVVGWARDLLTTTRLLIDSPAGQDHELRALLEDLELVLAQIVQLPGGGVGERELVEQGIEGRHMLLRLRAATPARPVRFGA